MSEERIYEDSRERSVALKKMAAVLGCGALAMTLVVVIFGIANHWVAIDVFALALVPGAVATLFAAAAFVLGSLTAMVAAEKRELLVLERTRKSQSAFDVEEDARFTAGRSLRNFLKFAPPALALLASLLIGGLLYFIRATWTARVGAPVIPDNPLNAAFITAVLLLFAAFAGAFCVGQSRERGFRWLRPVGAWLLMVTLVNVFATAVAISYHFGNIELAGYLREIGFWALALLAVEGVINFIIEFYRPRAGMAGRPVFESRLLALFTEPGGIMRNIADTLDYQFGFKVSKTWIYVFLERSLAPAMVLWLALLWLFTCVAEVGPDEVGIRELFGRRVSEVPLPSGVYLKAPWPFGNIARFGVYRVHEIVVGPTITAEDRRTRAEIVLWTKQHYESDSKFLVAVERGRRGAEEANIDDEDVVAVAFLSASFPIQYRIREDRLIDFAYKFNNPNEILKSIAEREITRYLASSDFLLVMSRHRGQTITELQEIIQKAVDRVGLGIDIVQVNLHDAHPPIDIADAFQDVIGAMEERETAILAAETYQEKQQYEAISERVKMVSEADSYRDGVIKVARAQGERFGRQLLAYREMPGMFKLRSYLEVLENDAADIRKYIVTNSLDSEIYELNFEERPRFDLIDVDISDLGGR